MSTTTTPPPRTGGSAADPAAPARRPGWAWLLVAVGGLVAAALVAGGTASLLGGLVRQGATGGERLAGVGAVQVRNDCAGDVEVSARGGPRSATTGTVDVRWRDAWSLGRPQHTQRLDGDRLEVAVRCPAVAFGWGPTSTLALVVPAGTPVGVDAGSGDVRATGLGGGAVLGTGSGNVLVDDLAGDLVVETGSGDLVLDRVQGDLTARTSSGSVLARALDGGLVDVVTGSGGITLVTQSPPQRLTGRTGSGSIDVTLPEDGRGYAVETETGSGGVRVDVVDAPGSVRLVDLRTGSGDITVRPAG